LLDLHRRPRSGCGTGAPKKAITQSPMNLSRVPPARKIASTARFRKVPNSSATFSGGEVSEKVVKPTRSANSTVVSAVLSRRLPAPSWSISSITAGEW
jgi:hypothetical protein